MRTCTVDECDRYLRYPGAGLCARHYHRRRRGNPLDYAPATHCETCGDALETPHPKRRFCVDCAEDRKLQMCRDFYNADKENQRQLALKRRIQNQYGITYPEYEAYVARGCAICGVGSDESRIHLDHDHATGAIRDALCAQCNVGLGSFADNPSRLRAAAKYIETHANRAPFKHDGTLATDAREAKARA